MAATSNSSVYWLLAVVLIGGSISMETAVLQTSSRHCPAAQSLSCPVNGTSSFTVTEECWRRIVTVVEVGQLASPCWHCPLNLLRLLHTSWISAVNSDNEVTK
eukprot:GHRQ01022619.1.p3 GENE.GHRQ01022619.1~~GHRQ01022619.1.p3  ORF type:complete len:103 (+),score=1.86 GHRQ01022619.1:1511-1819(+)